MKTAIWYSFLLTFITLIASSSLTGQSARINEGLYRCWIPEDYNNALKSGKTPRQIFDQMNDISEISFPENSDSVGFGQMHEGWYKSYKITTPNKISVYDYDGKELDYGMELITENDSLKIILERGGEKRKYVQLPVKYKGLMGIFGYVNDIFFEGEYVSDKNEKVVFDSPDKCSGIKDYNTYRVFITPDIFPPGIDYVMFFEQEIRIKKSELFHWKKEGDKLVLYSMTNDEPPYQKVKEKYRDLIKIK